MRFEKRKKPMNKESLFGEERVPDHAIHFQVSESSCVNLPDPHVLQTSSAISTNPPPKWTKTKIDAKYGCFRRSLALEHKDILL